MEPIHHPPSTIHHPNKKKVSALKIQILIKYERIKWTPCRNPTLEHGGSRKHSTAKSLELTIPIGTSIWPAESDSIYIILKGQIRKFWQFSFIFSLGNKIWTRFGDLIRRHDCHCFFAYIGAYEREIVVVKMKRRKIRRLVWQTPSIYGFSEKFKNSEKRNFQ